MLEQINKELNAQIMKEVSKLVDVKAIAAQIVEKLRPNLVENISAACLKHIEEDFDPSYLMEQVLEDEKLYGAMVKTMADAFKSGLKK